MYSSHGKTKTYIRPRREDMMTTIRRLFKIIDVYYRVCVQCLIIDEFRRRGWVFAYI